MSEERRAVALLCLLAAARVGVHVLAFPFFTNMDEQAHFDLVVAYSRGHVPREIESIRDGDAWTIRVVPNRYPALRVEEEWKEGGDALFASIRSGERIDDGDTMCRSTLMAILGRMAAYTGQTITWNQALASQEDLTPPEYLWGELAVAPIAVPGVTPFV